MISNAPNTIGAHQISPEELRLLLQVVYTITPKRHRSSTSKSPVGMCDLSCGAQHTNPREKAQQSEKIWMETTPGVEESSKLV
jgi:hypothetical protein